MCLKKIIYLLICINILIGCKSRKELNVIKDGNKEYSLKHKYHCELFIARPQIAVTDSFLILVSHSENEGFCQLHSIENKMEKVCTYGRIGKGPNDFLQPLLTYATGNSFGLNDLNLTNLAIMQVVQNNGSVFVKEQKRMKAPYKPIKGEFIPKDIGFVKVGTDHYVSCINARNGCFFTLFDSMLQPLMRFGESPVKEELPVIVSRSRLTGKTAVYGETFFYAASNLPYLASYTLQKDSMINDWDLFYRKPHYGVSNGDLKFSKENSTGPLLDLCADSNYIYLLYLDQLLSEYDYTKVDKSCADKIFVFNHKGEEVAILHLDCRISQMAIDTKRNKIYGIAEKPDVSLVEFELPELGI